MSADWGDDLIVPWSSQEIFAGLIFQWAGWWHELYDQCNGPDWEAPGLLHNPELVEGMGGYDWIKLVVKHVLDESPSGELWEK